jgi:UDP:flavonoid glycosyltransferase YjiC (YdhE family)
VARILAVTWDGAGNLPPERALARALVERGHSVHALTHDSIRTKLEEDGVHFLPLRHAEQVDSLEDIPLEREPFVMDRVFFGEGFSKDLLEAAETLLPDILVVDGALAFGLVAAVRTGLPTAALWHTLYSLVVEGPFGSLFDSRLPDINRHARELGLAPFSSFQALVESVDRVLVASYAPFDSASVVERVQYVGPLRPEPGAETPWHRTDSNLPLVVVALSTSGQGQVPLLQRLCDALAGLPVEGLVTTGPAVDPSRLSIPANIRAVGFLPHEVVLPTADLLITHAGHGTVMAGVGHGVPMLCVPMGRDQPAVAARVEELGLGVAMPADARTDELAAAISRSLEDSEMSKRAQRFANALTHHAGLSRAVEIVEALLEEGKGATL